MFLLLDILVVMDYISLYNEIIKCRYERSN